MDYITLIKINSSDTIGKLISLIESNTYAKVKRLYHNSKPLDPVNLVSNYHLKKYDLVVVEFFTPREQGNGLSNQFRTYTDLSQVPSEVYMSPELFQRCFQSNSILFNKLANVHLFIFCGNFAALILLKN